MTADEIPTRSELNQVAQALRQDWPIPPRVKRDLLQRAINLACPEEEEKPQDAGPTLDQDGEPREAPPPPSEIQKAIPKRTALAAHKVVIAYQRLSLEQQRLDLLRARYRSVAEALAETEGPDQGLDPELAARLIRALNLDPPPVDPGGPQHPARDP